jgi:hypothetical protein
MFFRHGHPIRVARPPASRAHPKNQQANVCSFAAMREVRIGEIHHESAIFSQLHECGA